MRLQDKVTIITGAGGGMGRTAARMFAAEGAKVVCVDVTEEMAESAAGDVRAAGGEATSVAADVSKEADARKMVDHAVATFGRKLAVVLRRQGRVVEAEGVLREGLDLTAPSSRERERLLVALMELREARCPTPAALPQRDTTP